MLRKRKMILLCSTSVVLLFFAIIAKLSEYKEYEATRHKLLYMYAHVEARQDALFLRTYVEATDKLLELTRYKDPGITLKTLEDEIKHNSILLDSCHMVAHEIGHFAYEKYKNFSKVMQYQNNICNSGYLHGVIESHFLNSKNVFADMKTVCGSEHLGSLSSINCYHGVGHGLMFYTSNDLPRALDLCESYNNEFVRSHCTIGVFMENFNTDGKAHPSKFLKEDNPFYPCEEQKFRHKHECYFYTVKYYLNLHPDDYIGALRWCEGAKLLFRSICAKAVGGYTMKQNSDIPKFVEGICMSNEKSQRTPCIDGMVMFHIVYYRSLESARAFCDQLEPFNQKACRNSVYAKASLFTG